MDFYKKTFFIFILFLLFFIILIKNLEPLIDKKLNQLFEDKKFSKKINKELENSTREFSENERVFYKNIIKKLYIKWIPLLEEAKQEAINDLKSKK